MSDQSSEEKFYELKPYAIIVIGIIGIILQSYTGNSAKFAATICYGSSFLLIFMGFKIIAWRSERRQVNQASTQFAKKKAG